MMHDIARSCEELLAPPSKGGYKSQHGRICLLFLQQQGLPLFDLNSVRLCGLMEVPLTCRGLNWIAWDPSVYIALHF